MAQTSLLGRLNPQSLSIVILHVTAEFSAGLAAPIRAIRHQFPYYVGIFNPMLAAELVGLSQITRAGTIIAVGSGYYLLTQSA